MSRMQADSREEKADVALMILGSPMLWGLVVTVGMYAALPYSPVYRDFLVRYLCGHWIEYVTMGLFFIGMAILAKKGLGLSSEKQAFQFDILRDPAMRNERSMDARCELLTARIASLPTPLRRTNLIQRFHDVTEYIDARRGVAALDDHLKYLADLAAERLHDSYGMLRTITWAIPILGFLGTVMGITIAIANVTPDQLDSSLNEVTGGLAIAFDTTAVSLTLSLFMVFSSFLVERGEQQILGRVEHVALSQLSPLFPADAPITTPLAHAESQAAEHLLEQSETMVQRHVGLWQDSLETLRDRWQQTMHDQQQRLSATLDSGLSATLADHVDHLQNTRQELVSGHRQLSSEVAGLVGELQRNALAYQQTLLQQSQELWNSLRSDFTQLRNEQHEQTTTLVETLRQEFHGWQTELGNTHEALVEQLHQLQSQGATLVKVLEQEQDLNRLQERLTDNLQALRGVDAFDETLHSLTAAVHLLTVRNRAA